MYRLFSNIANSFIDLVFPEHCIKCHKRGMAFCDNCIYMLRNAEREPARNIIACFDYREPCIKEAIWQLKYKNKKIMAKALAKAFYERMKEEIADMKMLSAGLPIIIIPIPLSKRRLKERGYNQSEFIADYILKIAPPNTFEINTQILSKDKDTLSQAKINNRSKRLANARGIFAFHRNFKEEDIVGRTIIILDDVTTTGGTMHDAMRVLKNTKAKKVIGIAIAH